MRDQVRNFLLAATTCLSASMLNAALAAESSVQIDSDDIGGQVTGAKGPEAGVWVIAETKDLKTRFIKVVATDDQGRYVIPDLPAANYTIFVRGYGLVDSKAVAAKPGTILNLKATAAPNAMAAAQYYPANYWYAMLDIPKPSMFPGTGPDGNGMPRKWKNQQQWMAQLQEGCRHCHQIGDLATRTLPDTGNSVAAWSERIKIAREPGDITYGDHGKENAGVMINSMSRLGAPGLKMFSDWTDKIRKGAMPPQAPPRPTGQERNAVFTIWDWGNATFAHDVVSTDRRNPTENANGPIYGMTQWTGQLIKLDPNTGENKTIPFPGTFPSSPHDASTNPHHMVRDQKGNIWVANLQAPIADAPKGICSDPTNKFAAVYPMPGGRIVHIVDTKTDKIKGEAVCFGSHHVALGFDANNTAYFSGEIDVMGWIDTKVYEATKDINKAQGWCPMVLDTNGDGKMELNSKNWNPAPPLMGPVPADWKAPDPTKDTKINGYTYGMNVSPADDSVWFFKYLPYYPGGLFRLVKGANLPETCRTEFYETPQQADGTYPAYVSRAGDIDSNGVVWVAFASGQIGAFDRRKCKVLNGPTATGQHCKEGWKFYDMPGPKMSDGKTVADHAYNVFIDHHNVTGLGKDTVLVPADHSDSLAALPPGADKFMTIRVPYPLGMYARGMDVRIDDPKTGWKGRGLWTEFGTVTIGHQEDGEGDTSKVVKVQFRPDPLAK